MYTKNLHITRTFILIVNVNFYIQKDPRGIRGYQALHSILKNILIVNSLKITGSAIFFKYPQDKAYCGKSKV